MIKAFLRLNWLTLLYKGMGDIRCWIALFFLLRLVGITHPPLEANSTWRQCDVLMIARNFYEGPANILYPRVDVAGSLTGIVGSEFPIYNYAIAMFAEVFGYEHWYGRIINLILGSISTYYFFLLIRDSFGQRSAFISSLIFLCSQAFSIFRTTLPDPFALSLCLIGIYYAIRYLKTGNNWFLITYFILATVGCLAKISSITVLTVLIFPVFDRAIRYERKILFCLLSSLVLVPVVAWYFYWVPALNERYLFGSHFFMGMDVLKGLSQLIDNWPEALKQLYQAPLKYSGFAAFLAAIVFCFKNGKRFQLLVFALPFFAYAFIIVKTGEMFVINPHYPFMFIPSMAFIAGIGLSHILNNRLLYVILLVIGIENVANQAHQFQIPESRMALTKLEEILDDNNVKRDDPIAINAFHVHHATPMYFAHRKGWNLPSGEINEAGKIESVKQSGCRYVVILKKRFGQDVSLDYEKIFDSADFAIYRL